MDVARERMEAGAGVKTGTVPDDDVFGVGLGGGKLLEVGGGDAQVEAGHPEREMAPGAALEGAEHVRPLELTLLRQDNAHAWQRPASAHQGVQAEAGFI